VTAASRARVMGLASVIGVLAVTGCGAVPGAGPAAGPAGAFRPPAPLALVAIVDPSSDQARSELGQLETVIQAGVTPSQTLVVSLLSATPVAGTYVVRRGDSLVSVAGANGVPLASLQGANPQLGPLAGRDWNRVYPGDRVTVPSTQSGRPVGNAIVTRAPAGPPAPALVRIPVQPANATTFQEVQYRRALAAAEAENARRIAAWRAEADTQLRPWQTQLRSRLHDLAGSLDGAQVSSPRDGDVAAAIQAAANTLAGLPGRRVLLLLASGRIDQVANAASGASLTGIHLVVANLTGSGTSMLTSAAAAAGATVTALDPALTELDLAAAVNG